MQSSITQPKFWLPQIGSMPMWQKYYNQSITEIPDFNSLSAKGRQYCRPAQGWNGLQGHQQEAWCEDDN